jgi:hypothetical protein
VASGSGPGAFLSEILKKNPVAGESGADAAAISRSAHATAVLAPPIRCDRHVSIRTPEEKGVGAAGTVAETPQNDGASQEGATPKPGAVRGTHVGGPRNAGVQGGTESSNLLSSGGESATPRFHLEEQGRKPRPAPTHSRLNLPSSSKPRPELRVGGTDPMPLRVEVRQRSTCASRPMLKRRFKDGVDGNMSFAGGESPAVP